MGVQQEYIEGVAKGREGSSNAKRGEIVRIAAIIRNSGLSLRKQGRPRGSNRAPPCATVRRNSNIRTITIKSGSARARRFRTDGERTEKGAVSYRLSASRPNRENAGNKLSRSFPQAVTDLWFIARLRRRILGEAKKRVHRCSFRDISQDRNEQSSRRRRERPPRHLLSTPRDTIVRRVNTFVDRENRRTHLHCSCYSENRDTKTMSGVISQFTSSPEDNTIVLLIIFFNLVQQWSNRKVYKIINASIIKETSRLSSLLTSAIYYFTFSIMIQ